MNKNKKRRMLAQAADTMAKAQRQTGRTCGDCMGCCERPSVEALDKPQCQVCKHVQPSGTKPGRCGIYDKRPFECRGFMCAWLHGLVPDGRLPKTQEQFDLDREKDPNAMPFVIDATLTRPDKLGLLVMRPLWNRKMHMGKRGMLWRILTIDGSAVDTEAFFFKGLQAHLRSIGDGLGVPVGFALDAGGGDMRIELPGGFEKYFFEELREAGWKPSASDGAPPPSPTELVVEEQPAEQTLALAPDSQVQA